MTQLAMVGVLAVGGWYVALSNLFTPLVALAIALCWASLGLALLYTFGGAMTEALTQGLLLTLCVTTGAAVLVEIIVRRMLR